MNYVSRSFIHLDKSEKMSIIPSHSSMKNKQINLIKEYLIPNLMLVLRSRDTLSTLDLYRARDKRKLCTREKTQQEISSGKRQLTEIKNIKF